MEVLPFILIGAFLLSITLSLLSHTTKRTSMEIVSDMGIGWNMGNSFDCFSDEKLENPDEVITLWGNIKPTKDLFKNLKRHGFKTIRFPITWMNFMNEEGLISKIFISKVKEVVDWIFSLKMYCLINVHHDSTNPFWLSKGEESKSKFIFLWTQISEEFKNYDDHLIFECMNDLENYDDYNFTLLYIFNQEFINVIRNSENYNKDRLLILSGANKDLSQTCSQEYKLPIDPYNNFAISIHYHLPSTFALEFDSAPWTYFDENGKEIIVLPKTQWGDDNDYKEMFTHFETLNKVFLNNGIPIIITETGVLTGEKKESESIRNYLFTVFSMSGSYDGIMACLWDCSNSGDMQYYDRINNKFYDEEIDKNFKKISRGKFPKPTDHSIYTNEDTITNTNSNGNLEIKIGSKKVIKVIFNTHILMNQAKYVGFGINSNNKAGQWIGESISGTKGKKQYDGSYSFTFDASEKDYNEFIEIQKWWGNFDCIIFNYLTVEFNQKYKTLDLKAYREALKA